MKKKNNLLRINFKRVNSYKYSGMDIFSLINRFIDRLCHLDEINRRKTCCVWVVWDYEALPCQNITNLNTRTND